jgi:putative OPT family oligopeptide transporter
MSTNHQPFVSETTQMREFTWKAILLGLLLTVILGAANAYLGLRAGVTVAATYPAAVISMAVLRVLRGTLLEENIARTAGTIGEGVAAGAIFTLPAFLIAGAWLDFSPGTAYVKSTALMMVGSILGVLFVSLLRKGMVEDKELPFPESVAAAEIHKAGQTAVASAKYLFWNMGFGGLIYLLGEMKLFEAERNFFFRIGEMGKQFKMGSAGTVATGASSMFAMPSVLPAYLGVGYIIGPRLAALNFAGGVLAWGLLVPLLVYFLGPQLVGQNLSVDAPAEEWGSAISQVWRSVVRPIGVGGMLVGACYTMFRMRKSLATGISRAVADVRANQAPSDVKRTDQYLSFRLIFGLIAITVLAMLALYFYISGNAMAAIIATVVMTIVGFFFAAVSGSLVGVIGSSNNPVSGLTLSTLIIAALLMISLGVNGAAGVTAVLGVAAVVCVSSAVAGELLQDFKAGWLLGGTPRHIQVAEIIAVIVASLVMYWPLYMLHSNTPGGLGGPNLPAPQASLMATLAQGIVGGDMPWVLVGVGVLMGLAMIMLQVKSPMLVSVGMYLPLGTTFAIFVGGMLKALLDWLADNKGLNASQKTRVENTGILVASGLIAGEGLMGLFKAIIAFFVKNKSLSESWEIERWLAGVAPEWVKHPPVWMAFAFLGFIAFLLVKLPLGNPGNPDDEAPPSAAH